MSTRALADERDEVGVDLVLERHVEPGVRVVARLLGEVERGELDARDEAEPDASARRRLAAADAGGRTWHERGSRRWRRTAMAPTAIATTARSETEASTATGHAGPPGFGAAIMRAPTRRRSTRTTTRYRATPSRAIVSERGEHQRDVEQAAAGEVDEDAEAALAAGPLADDRADDGERHARRASRRGSPAARPGSRAS